MTAKLTQRQGQVLATIERFDSEHGYTPTLRELGAALGIRSNNGISDHLGRLERKGYLRRSKQARSIVLLKPLQPDARALGLRLAELCREFGWRGHVDAIDWLREQLQRLESQR